MYAPYCVLMDPSLTLIIQYFPLEMTSPCAAPLILPILLCNGGLKLIIHIKVMVPTTVDHSQVWHERLDVKPFTYTY